MKWLIIAPDVHDENIQPVETCLAALGSEYTEVFIDPDEPKSVFITTIESILKFSYCIILDSCMLHGQSNYTFLLGLLLGQETNTFIYTGGKYNRQYEKINIEGQSYFRSFDSIKALLQYIKNNYELYKLEDKQHEAMKALFAQGIPFTSDSFAYYISKDKSDVCELFLSAGMITSAFTSEGIPMICVAARNDRLEKVEWLVENGANINAVSKDRGYTAVMDAVWRKNYDITKYLIDKGADLSVISGDGQSILVLAVGNENLRIVELLLASGADPDIPDWMGMSARGYAKLFKKPGMIKLMDKYPPKEK